MKRVTVNWVHTKRHLFYTIAPQEVKQTTALSSTAGLEKGSPSICPTPGCRGIGHIKGPRYLSHNTLDACPYAPKNLFAESVIPDRLQGSIRRQENNSSW